MGEHRVEYLNRLEVVQMAVPYLSLNFPPCLDVACGVAKAFRPAGALRTICSAERNLSVNKKKRSQHID